MKNINQKIIDAVIGKAQDKCPGSLALVGVYGSACTGDVHEKSDLDLLIVINDDNGWQLSDCFVLDDVQIAYDIYCTTWEMLEGDAQCRQAHLSKLMDSSIVYAADDASLERLERLRTQAFAVLGSDRRFECVDNIRERIRMAYADAMLAGNLGDMRAQAARVIYLGLDMVMLHNGRYFKKGVKRTFEELEGLEMPADFVHDIICVVRAVERLDMADCLTVLVRSMLAFSERDKNRKQPSGDDLRGTYEEMYSNWKNKMPEAAQRKDVFSSFMNLASLHFMLEEISEGLNITSIEIMGDFCPDDLAHNAAVFDNALEKYLQEYDRAGIKPRYFSDVDAFTEAYRQ